MFLKRSVFFIAFSIIFFYIDEVFVGMFFTDEQIKIVEDMLLENNLNYIQILLLAHITTFWYFIFYLSALWFEKKIKK